MAPAKKASPAKAKSSKPPAQALNELVANHADALASRLMAARPADAPRDVPGVTQGDGKTRVHAVGAPMAGAFGGLSPIALRKLLAGGIKSFLEVAVRLGGGTLEDLALSQRETLDDFVPDAAYEFLEKLMHRMKDGGPHVVGNTPPPTGPSAA